MQRHTGHWQHSAERVTTVTASANDPRTAASGGVFGRHSGHEQVVFCHDEPTGLRAIIAIYSTALGPALGGTRFYPYASEQAALDDVLNLSRGHGLQGRARRARPRRRQGRHHRRPGHRQVRGAAARLRPVRRSRSAAATTPPATSARTSRTWTSSRASALRDRPHRRHTAAPATPRSSRRTACSRACARPPSTVGRADAERPARRRRRRRQGRAPPGRAPARGRRRGRRHRRERGGAVAARRVPRTRRSTSSTTPTRWSRADIDVYAPCALGGALNDEVVAVAAGQSCAAAPTTSSPTPASRSCCADRGIALRPRLLRERRRLIQVADELEGFVVRPGPARAAEQIFDTTRRVFALAADEGVPPAVAADRLAERRMSEVGRLRGIWLP